MKTAQDYLAEKLQKAENSLKYREAEAVFWRNKYFTYLRENGKEDSFIEQEYIKASNSGWGTF